MCWITRSDSAAPLWMISPMPTCAARHRSPVCAATSGSNSATCLRLRASSARKCWRPAIMYERSILQMVRSCIVPRIASARPKLLSVCHHARSTCDCSSFPHRRSAEGAGARNRARATVVHGRKTGFPGYLLCAGGPLCGVVRVSVRTRIALVKSWMRTAGLLGAHSGVIQFTVGQRKRLGISGNREPLFVTRIDAATRTNCGRAT